MTPPELTDSVLSLEGRVAVLTMNRHEVRNELTGTHLAAEVASVADWINRDERVSALVLTGSGTSFSTGRNAKHMLDRQHGGFSGDVYEVQNKYRHGIHRLTRAMYALEVPSIAAVNGIALGSGFNLACLCDLRLGSTDARMAASSLTYGLAPGSAAWSLPGLVGSQRAAELLFSGRTLDAAEALRLGILLEVVEPDDLLARARELAAGFAARPPQSVRLTKRLLRLAERMEFHDYLEVCALMQGICHNTGDHIEAVTAFLEKRPPSFTGR